MDTHKSNHHNHKYKYTLRKTGQKYTKDYRVYFERHIISSSNGASGDSEGSSWSSDEIIPVSPFHDIPLYHDEERGVLNMVVEVPRWSNAKFEVRFLFIILFFSRLITRVGEGGLRIQGFFFLSFFLLFESVRL